MTLAERPFVFKIDLRFEPEPKALARAEAALGFAPPTAPNTVAGDGERAVLWLGPDEWLVTGPETGRAETIERLGAALAGFHASVVDVSQARTILRIAGPKGRELLAKGCPLDLHRRAFGAGRCAQSILAKVDILLHQVDDGPTFDFFVGRSYAEYLWNWLVDAVGEFEESET